MTLTREPSGRRASQIGERFVDAAADLADDALADVHQLRVVAEADVGQLDLAADFDEDRAGAVDHDVGDVVARQQRLERAVAEDVVADVLEQVFLLGDRHHDVLDRDDLVDDVADFLARRIGVELGELRQIDGVDQRAEDRGLDLVIVSERRVSVAIGAAAGAADDAGRRRRARTRAARRGRPTDSGARPARRPAARARRRGAARRRRRRRPARPAPVAASVVLRLPNTMFPGPCCSPYCFISLPSSGVSRPLLAFFTSDAAGQELRELPERLGGAVARTTLRRSSGRCWRRCRTAAARTE